MEDDGRFLQLLVADLALVRGLVAAQDVGAALMRGWDGPGDDSVLRELMRIADLPEDALTPIRDEAARLIQAADGDVRRALTEHGVDRSIHGALGNAGVGISQALTDMHAATRGPLRRVDPERYTNFLELGEGGMGIVYMALDTELNRWVAFKLVRPKVNGESTMPPHEAIRPTEGSPGEDQFHALEVRFLQEAWITGGLEHPGIVPVHELGQTMGGVPFYTMRLVRGARTLKDAIEELRDQPIEERLSLLEPFLKLCDAVRYAHDRGVVHRDLKPANVALGEYGEAILIDWGLAKLKGREDLTGSVWQRKIEAFRESTDMATLAGAMGTPGYMAPEAALGKLEVVNDRSDVYSLGALLYEILTGRLPFEFENFLQMVYQLASIDPPPAIEVDDSVPKALSDLCADALARDPAARPASADVLADRIREWRTRSTRDQEIEGHLRDVAASLAAAESATDAARLTQVDRALVALGQIEAKQDDHPEIRVLEARALSLRDRGLRERDRASARRVMRRVGVGLLVVAAVVGALMASLSVEEGKRKDAEQEIIARQNRMLTASLDSAAAEKLQHQAESLWPLHPSNLDAMRSWIGEAKDLLGRRTDHERGLTSRRESRSKRAKKELAVFEALIERLGSIREQVVEIERRFSTARALTPGAIGRASHQTWGTTIAAIKRSPIYGGLQIERAAVGLVPLGADPVSGLHEFAHIGSGVVPDRGTDGQLIQTDDSAIVLVLIPGGTFTMGAQSSDEAGVNYDPEAEANESPPHQVTLTPFFIGKTEVTQAQWRALTGGDVPSVFEIGESLEFGTTVETITPANPVEFVSWNDCQTWLGRHRLSLPTEAQWEAACRAGSSTRQNVANLRRVANVVDTHYEAELDAETTLDRFERHAPVGSLLPNAYGLHDMLGNVKEWCADPYAHYGEPIAGREDPDRVTRGGCWAHAADRARCSCRDEDPPTFRDSFLGVRAAAALD